MRLASTLADVASVAQALSLPLVAATFAYTVKQVGHLGRQLRLAVAYDRVGLMVRHELVDVGMVIEWHGQEIEIIWQRVGPLVMDERRRRATSRYCHYLEQLSREVTPAPTPVAQP